MMYLHWLNVRCCRCSFCNCCICTALIFIVADTFFETDVSATYFSLNLQMLFNLPVMYNCICILPFLKPEDASFANFASAPHVFYNVKMLLIEITHLQLALSITGRYSPPKLYIFNSPKSIIADIFPNILSCYLLHNLSQYITYQKIDIRNPSEYEMSVGDT